MDVTAIVQFALLLGNVLLLGCQAKTAAPTLTKLDEVLTCAKTGATDCTTTANSCTYKFYLGTSSSGGTLVKTANSGDSQDYTATQNGDYVCVIKADADSEGSDDSTAITINALAETPVVELDPAGAVCGRENLTVKCLEASTSLGVAASYIRLMKKGVTSAVVDWTPVAEIAKVVTTLSPVITTDKATKYTCQGAVDNGGTKEKISTTDEKPVTCSECTGGATTNCKGSPLGRTTCNGTSKDCEAPKPTTPSQTEQTSQKSGGDDSGSGTQKITLTLYLASLGTIISLMTFLQRG